MEFAYPLTLGLKRKPKQREESCRRSRDCGKRCTKKEERRRDNNRGRRAVEGAGTVERDEMRSKAAWRQPTANLV